MMSTQCMGVQFIDWGSGGGGVWVCGLLPGPDVRLLQGQRHQRTLFVWGKGVRGRGVEHTR
jgi:hypothetical protein